MKDVTNAMRAHILTAAVPYIKQYTVIYPAAFSVCSAGNLFASIISDARRVDSYKKWN